MNTFQKFTNQDNQSPPLYIKNIWGVLITYLGFKGEKQ